MAIDVGSIVRLIPMEVVGKSQQFVTGELKALPAQDVSQDATVRVEWINEQVALVSLVPAKYAGAVALVETASLQEIPAK